MTVKCEIIRDLLPLYIDGLTSSVSNEVIEEHLSNCNDCKILYDDMGRELPQSSESNESISDSNETKLMKKIKSKIVTVITTVIVTFSILGFIAGVYGKVIFQEGNPMPLLSSIIKLEFSDTDYVKYSSLPDKYISEFKPGVESYRVVIEVMREKGWAFKEQMGSGLVFEKGGEQTVVGTRLYTKRYFLWSIPMDKTKTN